MGLKMIICPDSHAKPFWERSKTKSELIPWDVANARYDALGRLIVHERPDIILLGGDHSDNKSLSPYDKGKRVAELQRLDLDVEAGQDALRRIEFHVRNEQERLVQGKRRRWTPRKVVVLGNHEFRYQKLVEDQPLFYDEDRAEGHLQYDTAGFAAAGWEVYPFLETARIEGFLVSHYFTSGIMGRAIGGEHPAHSHMKLIHRSTISFHSHIWDQCNRGHQGYGRMLNIVAGCFFGFHEEYAGPANHMWWRGITILDNVENGFGYIRQVGYEDVMMEYGNKSILY